MDPRTRLCERCGYVLEGLDEGTPGAVCPECGLPVAQSESSRRRGSEWQQRHGWLGLIRTWACQVRGPGRLMHGLAVSPARDRGLAWIHWVLASGILTAVTLGRTTASAGSVAMVGAWAGVFGASLFGHAALTGIERIGIRSFGARRRWRITRGVAAAITAHASLGWVLGALLYAGAQLAPSARMCLGSTRDVYAIDLLLGGRGYPLAPGAAWLAGLVLFECWVFVGVRCCRFGNFAAALASQRESGSPRPQAPSGGPG